MAKLFLQAHEVAAQIGLPDAAAFLRRRDRLEEQDYFPLPMPHSRRPLLWKADEVAAWVARNGMPRPPEHIPAHIPAPPPRRVGHLMVVQ